MAELAARNASAEAEVAYTDAVVLERVCKVVNPLGHGANEYADALLRANVVNVVPYTHDWRIEAKRYLSTPRRKVVRDRVLDDLEQLLLRCRRSDGQPVEELHHQAREAFERPRNSHGGADFDENAFGGMDVDLELAGLVNRRVKKGEQTLKGRCKRLQWSLVNVAVGTWWVMSGRASLMSRFIFLMMPMCSSLFSSEYLSSLPAPPRLGP